MNFDQDLRGVCSEGLLGPSIAETCGTPAFVFYLTILDTLLRKNEGISGACNRVKSIERPNKEYDYIVVGGGAGGAVVAARLSEDPKMKVLLLEAGPDESIAVAVPAFAKLIFTSTTDWGYRTQNEEFACFAGNGSCARLAAKSLGGCTTHNGMMYIRGNPTDYNNWAALGNEGWSWKEVKPFFMRLEDNLEIDRVGRENHGTGGPLPVERLPYHSPIAYSILDAANEAGFGIVEDLNNEKTNTGFTILQSNSKRGVRYSSGSAYLRPARNRPNLHISLESYVTKVIIKNRRAIGVEYYKNGKFMTVFATREVILSAGAVESPHLLLLSGIGPKDHLKAMDIQVVHDLPGVGYNFQDHPSHGIEFTVNAPDLYGNDWAIAAQYLTSRTGPFSGIGFLHAAGMLASKRTTPDFPDIQINGAGDVPDCAPGDIGALRSSGKRKVSITTGYLHPESRGRISLVSKDPLAFPKIWGNYLSNYTDVAGLLDGIQFTLKLADTKALKAWNFTLTGPIDACSHLTYLTEEYWTCAIRHNYGTQYHMSGTCKMGPASDPMAVVDPQLRVHGIERLRVIDASIMPRLPSGNTGTPTMMIGERGADMIKKYWISQGKKCPRKG